MPPHDYIIIGAGVVGLSSAYHLLVARPHAKVLVLEKEEDIAQHQTSHNSGVIHSGIYYKPGSARAINCVRGYKLLLDFCDTHHIPYNICGKVIVAINNAEKERLSVIYDRGVQNGLVGLKKLNAQQLNEIEPHAQGVEAIHVPQAGIISYKTVASKLKELILEKGGTILTNQQVHSINLHQQDWNISTTTNEYTAKYVITCGGLHSDRLARMTDPSFDLKIVPFRGEYYTLKPSANHLVKTLIYPVPNPNFPFLGVHFTNMIGGGVEAGPNAVFALGRESYSWKNFNSADVIESIRYPGFRKIVRKYWQDGFYEMYRSLSKEAFVKALQSLVPAITADDLIPGGAGVRAQAIDRQGNIVDDFLFHQSKNILHVVNAPSPAATSCLSIGRAIVDKIFTK